MEAYNQEIALRNTSIFIEAKKEALLGNYFNAEKLFLEVLKRDGRHTASMYELSGIYFFQKRPSDALDLMKKACSIETDNKWYRDFYLVLLESTGKYEEAEKLFEKLIKENPKDKELYFQYVKILSNQKKYSKAIGVYERLEKETGTDSEILFGKVRLYLFSGKVDKARENLIKLIQFEPDNVMYHKVLGDLYALTGDTIHALKAYRKALQINPNEYTVRLWISEYFRKQGDATTAFNELQQAFLSEEMDIDSKVKYLLKYYNADNKQYPQNEVYPLLDILTSVHSTEAKAWALKGDFLQRDKKHSEALEAFQQALQLDSSRYPIWEQVLQLDTMLQRHDRLKSDAVRAAELFPEKFTPAYLAGMALIDQNEPEQALKYYQRSKFLAGSDTVLLLLSNIGIGKAEFLLGNYEKADAAWEKALSTDPENTYVIIYLLQLRLISGNNLNKSLPFVERLLTLRNDPLALELSGDIYFKNGETEKALFYWKKALDAGSNSETLKKKIRDKKHYEN